MFSVSSFDMPQNIFSMSGLVVGFVGFFGGAAMSMGEFESTSPIKNPTWGWRCIIKFPVKRRVLWNPTVFPRPPFGACPNLAIARFSSFSLSLAVKEDNLRRPEPGSGGRVVVGVLVVDMMVILLMRGKALNKSFSG